MTATSLRLLLSLSSPPLLQSHFFSSSTQEFSFHSACPSSTSPSSSSSRSSYSFSTQWRWCLHNESSGKPRRIRGHSKGYHCGALSSGKDENLISAFTSDEDSCAQVPTLVQSFTEGSGSMRVSEFQPAPDVDYIQELLAIQQQGPRYIGFFGTRNMGFMHQELIEILSYALVITKNHIYTSGASGTNAAVIRGALRAEKPELLTVILPQSLKKQPPESQELLAKVKNVIEKPDNDHLSLIEASRLCNMDIISQVQQVICFAFHDSKLLMETCQEAKNLRKIVTLFYLD